MTKKNLDISDEEVSDELANVIRQHHIQTCRTKLKQRNEMRCRQVLIVLTWLSIVVPLLSGAISLLPLLTSVFAWWFAMASEWV